MNLLSQSRKGGNDIPTCGEKCAWGKKGWEPLLKASGIQPGIRVPPGVREDSVGGTLN
jgi:hypothetical protein